MTKAMILCAGQGTRVRPLTYCVPKPMINLINRPILSYILDHLKAEGVTDAVINTSYLPHQIENYYRDGSERGIRLTYSYEGRMTSNGFEGTAIGSAGGLRLVQDTFGYFDDTFVVLCGDAVIDLDIRGLIAFHKARGAVATIAAMPVAPEEVSKYGIIVSDDDGRIQSFQEKPKPEEAKSRLANTGIYVFEPEIFNHIPAECVFDIGGQLFPELIKSGVPFFASAQPFNWIDVGALQDYFTVTTAILNGETNLIPVPGVEVAPGIHCGPGAVVSGALPFMKGPIYFGSGAIAEPGSLVYGATLIGDNCVIEAGGVVDSCILGPYTRVKRGAVLQDLAIEGDWVIPRNGKPARLHETRYAGLVTDVRDTPRGWMARDAEPPAVSIAPARKTA
jgi:mannose-1-phosphate guanylyltransferase